MEKSRKPKTKGTREMNLHQETMYFWFEKHPVGGKILHNFECKGKPNIKIVYDIKKNKVKTIEYRHGGKLVEEIKDANEV